MYIYIKQSCPKQIKWADVKKYVDKAYDYPIIQLTEYDNKLWIKHTPARYKGQFRKPFYVVVEQYLNREYHHILDFAFYNNIDARHFHDAVLAFYVEKIRKWEI